MDDAAVYHMLGNHFYCSEDVCKHKRPVSVATEVGSTAAADANTEKTTETALENKHQEYIHTVVARRLSDGLLFHLARGVRTQACEVLLSMVVSFTHGCTTV